MSQSCDGSHWSHWPTWRDSPRRLTRWTSGRWTRPRWSWRRECWRGNPRPPPATRRTSCSPTSACPACGRSLSAGPVWTWGPPGRGWPRTPSSSSSSRPGLPSPGRSWPSTRQSWTGASFSAGWVGALRNPPGLREQKHSENNSRQITENGNKTVKHSLK